MYYEVTHLEVHGVDGSGLARDVAVAGPGVRQEHVAELLPTLPDNNNPDDNSHEY